MLSKHGLGHCRLQSFWGVLSGGGVFIRGADFRAYAIVGCSQILLFELTRLFGGRVHKLVPGNFGVARDPLFGEVVRLFLPLGRGTIPWGSKKRASCQSHRLPGVASQAVQPA